MERHVQNARRIADFLREDSRVAWVNFAGFQDNPNYTLVQRYMSGQASSVFTFGLKGGLSSAKRFYDALVLVKRVVNLGDVRSLACHPASTTHRQMTGEQQRAAGITPELIRMSVGIEHPDDIIADLQSALTAAFDRLEPLKEVA
jgi:O-acetylhomoserine (thiol)-lyase